jgi:hypothetical protein
MLGEVVFGAPAIFETESVSFPIFADLGPENRIECQQEIAGAKLDNRTELDLVSVAAPSGKAVTSKKRQAKALVFLDLDQLVLQLELH